MRYSNLKVATEQVNFKQAVLRGLGREQGLFFPDEIPQLENIEALLKLDFIPRSVAILKPFVEDVLTENVLEGMLIRAFNFPLPMVQIDADNDINALELFHGPSLAFKDFGARFLAECFAQFSPESTASETPLTILTATSGDTGAAVAHAFLGQKNIRAVIIYPKGKITKLQEKLFCTLGENIHTIAIDDDFDSCQQLVKEAFSDPAIRHPLNLNSANSINMARLLAQVCYYFEAAAQLGYAKAKTTVFSVPSGNFGNATAGMIAHCMGLPFKRLIAATNENDTVPRFLAQGLWDPRKTVATLTNAMDISLPNNFVRIQQLAATRPELFEQQMFSVKISETETLAAVKTLYQQGYLADPHSALAYAGLIKDRKQRGNAAETAVFACTAHPAKFRESLQDTLKIEVELPSELAEVANRKILSVQLDSQYSSLKQYLLALD
ncbi:MAG: threonine synthase [Xanthomonadales bacterium]|nr:threonine synthase [Xanthomonadales bacterium]